MFEDKDVEPEDENENKDLQKRQGQGPGQGQKLRAEDKDENGRRQGLGTEDKAKDKDFLQCHGTTAKDTRKTQRTAVHVWKPSKTKSKFTHPSNDVSFTVARGRQMTGG